MNSLSRRTFGAVLLTGALAACNNATSPASGTTSTGNNRANIDREIAAALEDLYRRQPGSRTLAQNARAILVFPNVTSAGLGIGGSYGTGGLRENGRTTAYYNLIGGSFGFQIGAQTFSQAYFFNTPQALETFRRTLGFEAGAGVSAVAADFGANAEVTSSTLQKPVVVVSWGQSGLMAGATIEGVKMTEIQP